jgi:NADH-quinone oxidoreductase subunit M
MSNQILADAQIGFPILSALIALPLVAALLLALVRDDTVGRRIALAAAVGELALALWMAVGFVAGIADMQFVERRTWIPSLGIGYSVGVDGISMLFVPLAAIIALAALLSPAAGVRFMPRMFAANVMFLLAATVGIFVALDLVLFYVFFELALIPAFLMIRLWGSGAQREHAGMKYIVFMLCGSVPLLLGFIMIGIEHQAATGRWSFDLVQLMQSPLPAASQGLLFLLLVTGFAVKGPLLPLHSWMPAAISEGPIGAGLFLVGLKLGAYGFLRFVMPLLPLATLEWWAVLVALGLAAMLIAALVALVQRNLRRLLTFASISHVGLVVVGLFSLTTQGMQGALLLLLSMGLTSTGLLLLVGALQARTGSADLGSLGGVARHMPRLATLFFIIGIASVGMPGTLNFNGEFLILMGAYFAHPAIGVVGVLGVILSAGYFLWYYERAFLGPVKNAALARLPDLGRRDTFVAAALAALALWGGLFPATLQEVTAPSVAQLREQLRTAAVADAQAVAAAADAGVRR